VIETVGVDVGGTKVSAAALRDGELGEPVLRPTAKAGPAALLDEIVGAVEAVRGPGLAAVGVGVPSVVDFAAGRARSSVNVPLQDVPLRDELAERLGVPVFVDNDATVAALAEAWEGAGIAVESLVMFTVGTGVGGGLVLGGRIYRGKTGAAAEVGHTLIGVSFEDGVPEPDGFPQPGSLESLSAGTVLDRLAREQAERAPDSVLGHVLADAGEVNGRDAVVAARAGDRQAGELVRLLGERLGIGIANAINLLDPEVVAVGGGVSVAGELLLGPARETAQGFVLPGVGTATEIRLARRGLEAGVLGAALLALTESPAG
jgi:glucokinase